MPPERHGVCAHHKYEPNNHQAPAARAARAARAAATAPYGPCGSYGVAAAPTV